ncbi:MAG: hypothetical protein LKI60_08380 [Bifidobacterium tibiigranuli]|jgi:hypothetical protein|uniref:hypothetical protein n=1 Tax=Bifidobacterium tibiigranuli TaxID=2172043 RepID=UPI002357773A|nr:hypothetical protein [Bifidobacterium tibiigranuli]MCH3975960.1 hypothetical protein [Bifidobacterium tibiigranuli]MCH4190417.1 hypothetical protein [Bifidobacterium tibiigranuli]MCI1798239.1 hypothetical protein [Bifidobacterium tibiigranuli]
MNTSNGFRHTETTKTEPTKTERTPVNRKDAPTISEIPITAQVVQALVSGKTPRMAAQDLGLPLDFVNLVIEQARISGDIDFFELRTENCTAGSACQPDPESMVCASCPILPPSIRKQQSPLGKLRRVISSHRLRKGQPAKV